MPVTKPFKLTTTTCSTRSQDRPDRRSEEFGESQAFTGELFSRYNATLFDDHIAGMIANLSYYNVIE